MCFVSRHLNALNCCLIIYFISGNVRGAISRQIGSAPPGLMRHTQAPPQVRAAPYTVPPRFVDDGTLRMAEVEVCRSLIDALFHHVLLTSFLVQARKA